MLNIKRGQIVPKNNKRVKQSLYTNIATLWEVSELILENAKIQTTRRMTKAGLNFWPLHWKTTTLPLNY